MRPQMEADHFEKDAACPYTGFKIKIIIGPAL